MTSPRSRAVSRGASRRAAVWLIAALGLAACDRPTAAPRFEQTWILPVADASVTLADLGSLFPASVQFTNGALRVTVPSVDVAMTIDDLCDATCRTGAAIYGVPPMTNAVTAALPLPADVRALTVSSADPVQVSLFQSTGIDLLAPTGAATPGTLALSLGVGADTARLALSGATQTWPSGSTIARTLAFPTPSVVTADPGIRFAISVPAADPATLSSTGRVTAHTASTVLGVSSVTVHVSSATIATDLTQIDLADLDADKADYVTGASVALTVENPITIGGSLALHFRSGTVDLIPAKTITVAAGTSTSTISLTKAEFAALAGHTVQVRLTGAVAPTTLDNTVTIRPTDVIAVRCKLTANLITP